MGWYAGEGSYTMMVRRDRFVGSSIHCVVHHRFIVYLHLLTTAGVQSRDLRISAGLRESVCGFQISETFPDSATGQFPAHFSVG